MEGEEKRGRGEGRGGEEGEVTINAITKHRDSVHTFRSEASLVMHMHCRLITQIPTLNLCKSTQTPTNC